MPFLISAVCKDRNIVRFVSYILIVVYLPREVTGLPTTPGKAYILDISGALFDDVSGQPLKGLGKLAPS